MDNEKLFEFMEKMYSEMQIGFKKVNADIEDLKSSQEDLKSSQEDLKSGQEDLRKEVNKTNFIIENDIKPKIEALFDGYKQNSEQLNRIENEVCRHEEVIIRRIK